jgi:hypothetical protein
VRGEDIKTPVLIKKTVVTRARSLYSAHTDRARPAVKFFFSLHPRVDAETPTREREGRYFISFLRKN